MIVVSDTSPLNYLVLIEHVHLLPSLFSRVLVPAAVMTELRHPGSPPVVCAWATTPPPWLEIRAPAFVPPGIKLGPGEAEAIGLAQELKADAVLIDERKAATVAKGFGLFVTGTLGVLEIAAEQGLVNLPDVLDRLVRTNFRIAPQLLREILDRDATRQQHRNTSSHEPKA